jgi:hypothetical protein
MGGLSATCSQHPRRAAVGVCVQCSVALCGDCITKIDGVNHCQRCLLALGGPASARPRARRAVPSALGLGLGLSLLSLLTWLMLEVLMPGAGTL